MSPEHADIVIVGAGASGAAAAWSLSLSDFKIVCLEQGSYVDPKSYPKNSHDWEIKKEIQFDSDPNIRKLDSDYPIDNTKSPISIANYNAVGGSSILFSGHFPRFHSTDFKTKSTDGIGEDWPLSYDDLLEFYDLNDQMMGVSGLEGDPKYPEIKNLLPPVPLGKTGKKIAEAFTSLGWHWWPSYSAIITQNFNGRKKCENFGACNTGCPNGSKSSVDVTYWPKAISNGVDLRVNSRVVKVLTNNDKLASGVEYFDHNSEKKIIHASLVILACNGIGTPRLLMNSSNESFPTGLANSSNLVGKNLMLHPLGFVEGKFDEFLESYSGPQGCCILSQEFYDTREENLFKRGYTMQLLKSFGPLETVRSARRFNKIKYGENFHEDFFKTYGHTIPMTIICEDFPELENCVELDLVNRDSSDMPGVKINYKLSENSKKMLSHGINKAKNIMKVAGAKSISAFGPVRNTGWHLMGTTKMGKDNKKSVVNSSGQTHDIKNLVIVDSSIFVTSGGVNPMSTIQALALKIANDIKSEPNKFFIN